MEIEIKNVYNNESGKEGLIVEYVDLSQPSLIIPYHLVDKDNTRTAKLLRQKTKFIKPKNIKDFSSIGTSENIENAKEINLLPEKIKIDFLSFGLDVSIDLIKDNKEDALAYLGYLRAERFSDLIKNNQ